MNKTSVCTICFLIFSVIDVHSQKYFNINIKLPVGIDEHKLEVYYDNGKTIEKPDSVKIKNGNLFLSSTYYSLYAFISIQYRKDSSDIFSANFFVQDKASSAILKWSNEKHDGFVTDSLVNAFSFKKDADSLNNYIAYEREKLNSLSKKYGYDKRYMDSSTLLEIDKANYSYNNKIFEFISSQNYHRYSYFFFYVFTKQLVPFYIDLNRNYTLSADSLLKFYDTFFPDSFRNSLEGKFALLEMQAKSSVKDGGIAPDFTAKDINNTEITLSSFRNKKYVLLNFWATWCGPCMGEMPAIKNIYDQFGKKDLEIVAIDVGSRYSDYMNVIKTFPMNWTNIPRNDTIYHAYGYAPIPQLYLIDKSGVIIYNRSQGDEADSDNLSKLKSLLKEKLRD